MRLIATDVDGTLIRSDHTLSARTRRAFQAARDAGIRVLAISGRQPYSIGAIVQGTALMGPCVGSNGAVITDLDIDDRFAHFPVFSQYVFDLMAKNEPEIVDAIEP